MADKSQAVRLIDVYLLGPFLLYLAFGETRISKPKRFILAGIGLSTIAYNYRNYILTRAEEKTGALLPTDTRVVRG